MANLSQMSYSTDSYLIKVYLNHKNWVLVDENTVIVHGQRTWGGVRWELRNPSVYFFVTLLKNPPLIPVLPLQLCYICSILSHPWGMPWQRIMRRKRKGSASALCASPQLTSCGAEEAEPGVPEPSRSEWGRSSRGDKLEDQGNFLVPFSPHSRQMTNSR